MRPGTAADTLLWTGVCGTSAIAVGAAAAFKPQDGLLVVLAGAALLAIARPGDAIVAAFAIGAINSSVWLKVRLVVGGTPLSPLDALPLLVLVSAVRMRPMAVRQRSPAALNAAFGLMAVGFVVGIAIGASAGAGLYQLAQIGRIELGLLVGLLATMIAGHVPQWRGAVLKGLIAAGWIVAIELILTFAFPVLTGRSLWGLLGVSSATNVSQEIATGNLNALREILINNYVILPAIAIVAVRRTRNAYLLATVGIVGLIVSLERGSWLALAVTIVIVVAFMLSSGGSRSVRAVQLILLVVLALGVAEIAASGYIASRVSQTNLSGQGTDVSANYRTLETDALWSSLRASPAHFLEGTGPGNDLPAYQAVQATAQDYTGSTIFEDSILSRWVNFTILSALGAIVLLLIGFRVAWQMATRSTDPTLAALAAAGLSLPALLLVSPISGTLEGQGTLPYWLLAGTLLAGWSQGGWSWQS